ncbi:trafficking protein particle complex subunit 5-like [Oppia nitens]|uniref:trafficking protein particle complex subunit 5-like n=1 Tax=Oppia nitens TaxID=1686743 RepID=UPI0023DBFEA5|nr:trafficking protein particle complex subunit 5-like [Oppia nitens]
MDSVVKFTSKTRISCLDKSLPKIRNEISLSAYALLISEMVQYCHNRVYTVPELQTKLAEMGYRVGQRVMDAMAIRDKNFKRETRIINMLVLLRTKVWINLFGKEADKLEQANDDETTYYIIESEPLINKYISVPKDKGALNCAAFVAGIIEAVLNESNFKAKVTVHWHKGTTFMIKFDDSVVTRDKTLDNK